MKTAAILRATDFREIKSWFAVQTGSKLAVLAGFILVIAGLEVGLFSGMGYYFRTLAAAQDFGYHTADYIIRATFLVVMWLGIGSSAAATANLFFTKNKNLAYLLTLPVDISDLVRWQTQKTITFNTFLLAVLLAPLLLAFRLTFVGYFDLVFILRAVLGLFGLALVATALGGSIGFLLVAETGRSTLTRSLLHVGVFLGIMVLIFRLVFPPALASLTRATPSAFYPLYQSLPLARSWVPTNWLAGLITVGTPVDWLLSAALVIFLLKFYLWLECRLFLTTYWQVNSRPQEQLGFIFETSRLDFARQTPLRALMTKDLSAVIRSPGEIGYGVFLASLVVFFFGLFSRVSLPAGTPLSWIILLQVFAFLGLVFFTNTFLLRLAFPDMAKEGETAWYLFTQPLAPEKLWLSKVLLAQLLILPFLFVAATVWLFLSFTGRYYLLLAGCSLIMIIIITLLQAFLGLINPNFSESHSAEKISTSYMGLITLVITTTLALGVAAGLDQYLSGNAFGILTITGSVIIGLVLVGILGAVSRSGLRRYEF